MIWRILYTRRIEHALGSYDTVRISICVTVINECPDPRLDDGFCTLIAGKQRDIQLRSLQTASAVVQDRIQFTMGGIQILVVIRRRICLFPGKIIIGAADRLIAGLYGSSVFGFLKESSSCSP